MLFSEIYLNTYIYIKSLVQWILIVFCDDDSISEGF
jgi:hypothetical protein